MKAVEFIVEYSKKQIKSLEDLIQKKLDTNEDRSVPIFPKGISAISLADRLQATIPPDLDGYIFWILHRYAKDGIKRWDDIGSRAIPGLIRFKELRKKNKIPAEYNDINKFKTLDQLDDLLDKYREKDEPTSKKSIEKSFYEKKEATLIYNSDDIKVVIPHTEEASCFFGKNTRWCTAAKYDNQFQYYNQSGPLYIILIKKENKRYQLHYSPNGWEQFMDELDHPAEPAKVGKEFPILYNIFTPIANQNESLTFNSDPSEKLQLRLIKRSPRDIVKIKNPTEKVKFTAVKLDPSTIQWIKDPTPEVQKMAVSTDAYTIAGIEHPTVEVQFMAIKHYPNLLKQIKNVSPEVINYLAKQYEKPEGKPIVKNNPYRKR